jgi:flagellar motor switch protein FliG
MAQSAENQSKGVFLNGKAQIIEMLKVLDGEEKQKLIKLVTARNPSLGKELQEKSFSFNNLMTLSDSNIKSMIRSVNAQIMGIALKGCNIRLQKKVLSLAPREYAEEAYEILVSGHKNEQKDITRAQERVLAAVIQILKRNQVNASL